MTPQTNTSTIVTMTGATLPGFWEHSITMIFAGLIIGFFGNKLLEYLWVKYIKKT